MNENIIFKLEEQLFTVFVINKPEPLEAINSILCVLTKLMYTTKVSPDDIIDNIDLRLRLLMADDPLGITEPDEKRAAQESLTKEKETVN